MYEENWRNKTHSKDKTSLIEKIKPKHNANHVQLLPNGNISRTNINDVILRNTCAFDAVVHSFAVAYSQYISVKTMLASQNSLYSTLIKAVSGEDDSVDILRLRAAILLIFF